MKSDVISLPLKRTRQTEMDNDAPDATALAEHQVNRDTASLLAVCDSLARLIDAMRGIIGAMAEKSALPDFTTDDEVATRLHTSVAMVRKDCKAGVYTGAIQRPRQGWIIPVASVLSALEQEATAQEPNEDFDQKKFHTWRKHSDAKA